MNMRKYQNNKSGFTLVELSIVLVIIGLVAGGILLGNDLIEAAKVRKQISQLEEIESQINAFKLKYDYLPGDIPDASEVFGSSFGGYTVRDGDGDGKILGSITNSNTNTAADCYNAVGYVAPIGITQRYSTGFTDSPGEIVQVFHHLNAAGLGNYDINQQSYDSSGNPTMRVANPKPPFNAFGGRIAVTCTHYPNQWWAFPANFFNRNMVILIGGRFTTNYSLWNSMSYGAVISPASAENMDIKIDDGKPLTGILGSWSSCNNNTGVTAYITAPSSNYNDYKYYKGAKNNSNTPLFSGSKYLYQEKDCNMALAKIVAK